MASKQAVAKVIREIFGSVPTSRTHRGVRNGMDVLAKTQTGPYDRRYFMDPIEPYARKAMPDGYPIKYTSALQQRRLDKLDQLRRRGKGPPKKGSGKRASKGK
mmetsp:Transcript_21918/g.47805  ORF Transcript_21918/g.47805 Transcript_21918/m.47805 type:complete len:103 (+) Transcript_21918:290-598(+)